MLGREAWLEFADGAVGDAVGGLDVTCVGGTVLRLTLGTSKSTSSTGAFDRDEVVDELVAEVAGADAFGFSRLARSREETIGAGDFDISCERICDCNCEGLTPVPTILGGSASKTSGIRGIAED